MANQFAAQERKTALAKVLHELHQALESLRIAHHTNHINALSLDLPSEKPLTEAIHSVVQTYQQPQGVKSHE